jgi:Flp pilus assembly protein TadB
MNVLAVSKEIGNEISKWFSWCLNKLSSSGLLQAGLTGKITAILILILFAFLVSKFVNFLSKTIKIIIIIFFILLALSVVVSIF